MADVADGKLCPSCLTFTTCSGANDDELLVGRCPCCKRAVTMQHHRVERLKSGAVVHVQVHNPEQAKRAVAGLTADKGSVVTGSAPLQPTAVPSPSEPIFPQQAELDALSLKANKGELTDMERARLAFLLAVKHPRAATVAPTHAVVDELDA